MDRNKIGNAAAKLAGTIDNRLTRGGLERWTDEICRNLSEYHTETVCAAILEFVGAENFPSTYQIETACERLVRAKEQSR